MSLGDDAATVLEQFTHDAANLPAEIAHLLEEIHAKDVLIQECRTIINNRDAQLQKHVKTVGGHIKNAKEEQQVKLVLSNYDKAQLLQDDKVNLSQKACFLVCSPSSPLLLLPSLLFSFFHLLHTISSKPI